MKLLIVTQTVDTEDPALGFFVGWIQEFAKHAERIEVICLKEGKYDLPANVRVHSLGKEHPPRFARRLVYAARFKLLAWRLRHDYDAVFVHMNQEYVLIAGLLWKFLGKKIALWRNHPLGGFATHVALVLANVVFTTSPYAYVARSPKVKFMPVGIDTDYFHPSNTSTKLPNSILMFGRVAPIKKVVEFVDVLSLLQAKDIPFSANIVGDATLKDKVYYTKVSDRVLQGNFGTQAVLTPSITLKEAPALYTNYTVVVNLTPTGSFDKTILESMACGTLVVTTNQVLKGAIPDMFVSEEDNLVAVAKHIENIFTLSPSEYEKYALLTRNYVIEQHSLEKLSANLFKEFALLTNQS